MIQGKWSGLALFGDEEGTLESPTTTDKGLATCLRCGLVGVSPCHRAQASLSSVLKKWMPWLWFTSEQNQTLKFLNTS